MAEIDNLNALINGVEQEMLRLKKRYEVAVEERNYTGIQLIDRNDELWILYEKANMQQTVLKKGELTIREREEEIRLLDLQVAELVRDVEVTRRKARHRQFIQQPTPPQVARMQLHMTDRTQRCEPPHLFLLKTD